MSSRTQTHIFINIYVCLRAGDDLVKDSNKIVWLNVYDMSPHNKFSYPFGLGIFHSGIEVYGTEYAFGGHDQNSSGVFQMTPKVGVPGITLRKSIELGTTELSRFQVRQLIERLSRSYTGISYDILSRNCNHFTNELAQELCKKKIPKWVNRLAGLGALMPCGVQTGDRSNTIVANQPDLNQSQRGPASTSNPKK